VLPKQEQSDKEEEIGERGRMNSERKAKTDTDKDTDKTGGGEQHVFHAGDRVVLHGLVKMKRINGNHGVIAGELDETTGRYRVFMDLLDQLPAVTAKPANLKREASPDDSMSTERAQVMQGCLVETQGRAFSLVLDVVRYLVAYVLHEDPEIQHFDDIMRVKDVSMEKANFLTATAWTHWDDPGSYKVAGDRGIYQCLLEYLPEAFGVVDGNTNHLSEDEKLPLRALTDRPAVAGWSHRLHGNFWVCGKDPDDGGTLLVPVVNKLAVYKVFGMTSCLYDLLARAFPGGKPVQVKLTMVPWYGRLVYDGLVSPIDPRPSKQLIEKLQKAVKTAQEEGRVVERLMQLELAEAPKSEATTGDSTEEEEATPEERLIIASLAPIATFPESEKRLEDRRDIWVFRRTGYTEDKNPEHTGVIMAAGDMIGPFKCSALEPVSTDILKWLVSTSLAIGKRPTIVNIDDKACYKRVKHLLKDVEGIHVEYYPPATEEEQAALNIMDRAGQAVPF
jgi:hypothetical protein